MTSIVPTVGGLAVETSQFSLAGTLDPRTVVLARGEVTDSALASLGAGHVTATLSARAVPIDVVATPAGWAVMPRVPLSTERHTLAVGSPRLRKVFDVEAALPRADIALARTDDVLVCVDGPRSPVHGVGAVDSTVDAGVAGTGDLGCWTVARPLPAALADESGALVASIPPTATPTVRPRASADCAPPRVDVAGACVAVEDDRLVVTDAPTPSLLLLGGLDATVRRAITQVPQVIRGLRPAQPMTLDVTLLTADGGEVTARASVVTAAARPRPVLMEALADPVGPEPDGEWIELSNDGALAVDLTGYTLRDAAGASALPSVVLPGGATALLVTETFVPTAPMPPKDCRLIRLPSLGKNGLSNDGEPVELVAPDGKVKSRLPALKGRAGQTIARRSADVPDDDSAGFSVGPPTPCVAPAAR